MFSSHANIENIYISLSLWKEESPSFDNNNI